MARFSLPRLNIALPVVTDKGFPTPAFHRWWQNVVEAIETQENTQDDLLAAIIAAQSAADTAAAAAATAATAAADAQAAADAAQATADAITIPPTGSRSVSTNTILTSDDFSVLVDASGGPVTITLFAAAAAQNTLSVQKVDASANAVDVQPGGSDNLNGSGGAISLAAQFDKLNLTSDGNSDWYA